MVLLPGCACCQTHQACQCTFPDFVEVDASFTVPSATATLKAKTYWYYNGVPDDVYEVAVSMQAPSYSGQTFRLSRSVMSLNAFGAGESWYVFSDQASGVTLIFSIVIDAGASGCVSRSFSQLRASFVSGTASASLLTNGTLKQTSENVELSCNPTPAIFCGGPTRSQSLAPIVDGFYTNVFTIPVVDALFRQQAAPYARVQSTNNIIFVGENGPETFTGTENAVWPYTINKKSFFWVNKLTYQAGVAISASTDIENNGFTQAPQSTQYIKYFTLDYSYSVHAVRFVYGDTFVNFPTPAVYGPLL